ncbi:anion permease [Salmonella enterica]|nr:sodium:sulfate symporter [Salmonella enterica]EJG7681374.1 anion permease [Salmonella enterica]HAG2476848.1 sodium:sulfate symporter [Salmonella enterica]HBL9999415.1 anion permease [Salmonella enterica subsp. enterica serovar Kodjovi]HDI1196814.1 anion permease [Salmonella enterica]
MLNRKNVSISFYIIMLCVSFLPAVGNEVKTGVVILFTIILWATSVVPEWFSSFTFLTICSVFSLATPDVVFSGFTSSAAWLVISGIIISAAITHVGLGNIIASYVFPAFTGTCKKAIFISALFGLLTAFIMPSAMNRIILIIPILDSVALKLGYNPDDKGYKGVVISGVLGTYLPATTILPANIPNNILIGLVDKIFNTTPTYFSYFVLHFPVMGFLKLLLTTLIIIVFYNDKASTNKESYKIKVELKQKVLAFILLAGVVLWMTESLHKISTSTISLIIAVICLIPGAGFLPRKPLSKLNTGSFFYVATIVSSGTIAYQSGVAKSVANQIISYLPLNDSSFFDKFFSLSALSGVMGLVVTTPGVPGVLTPMTDFISKLMGLSVEMTYMTQVVGFSTIFFVYQAPPLVIACQTGKLSVYDVSKICFISSIVSVIMLWPLDSLWWKLITPYIF